MNKLERTAAVVAGRPPDRPPVSFWYHFGSEAAAGPQAVEAHLRHIETYDLDFLKLMNDNRYPRQALPGRVVADVHDLEKLSVLNGDEETFGQQLDLIRELARHTTGQFRMATTIFNSWSTLRQMTATESGIHGPPTVGGSVDPQDAAMSRLLRESPDALGRALEVVAQSLANFARQCLAAGADGVFLSVRDDWVDSPANGPGVYNRLVQPGDLAILAATQTGTFNMLHVCGRALDFRRFAGYPVQVINWADRYAGPAIAEVASWVRPALCAGLDNLDTMVTGSPEDCARQVADALDQAAGRPMIIAPGCTYDPQRVPAANLHAIRQAVEIAAERKLA
jgi:uroporphyrinogen decarboxylase